MGCEKYASRLTDAALGELPASEHGELLAHTGRCNACREAYERAQELAALVDAQTRAFVTGDPSPRFAAILRARIDATGSANNSAWAWRIPAVASAAIVAAIFAVNLPHRRVHNGPPPSTVAATNLPESDSTLHPNVSERNQIRGAATSHWPHEISAQPTSAQPEILVPQGQLELALRLSDAIEKKRTNGTDMLSAQQEIEKPLEIKVIAIEPMGDPPPIQPSPFSDFYEGF